MTARPKVRLRPHRPGDVGWMLQRHAELYAREFGYLPVFEAYVAEGIPPFLRAFDPRRDRLWVAEGAGGRRLGCIAIQHDPRRRGWAKLRWFLVEPEARGLRLGSRLIDAALRFSRRAGYRGIHLWTVDDLAAARRLYESRGFRLAEEGPRCAWAPWGREQRWELRLPRLPASRDGASG
jgi:GNAT superfamily N-acetyltransferase